MAEADRDDLISIIEEDDKTTEIPTTLPLLPVRDVVVYPFMILPLFVGRDKSIRAVEEALSRERLDPAGRLRRDADAERPGAGGPLRHRHGGP